MRPLHRSRHVDQQARLARQASVSLYRTEHRMFEFRLQFRRMLRGSDEAIGQNAVGAHFIECHADGLLRNAGMQHAAQIAQQRQRAELLFGDQALERRLLVGAA